MRSGRSSDRIVRGYLKRLRVASRELPRPERRELRAQIEEHLRVAIAPDAGEAEVLTVLERLGAPEEIVAEQYGTAAAPRGIGAQAVTAIVLLLVGGFMAGVGWIVGVVLLWSSHAWTTREKLIGTLVVPGGLFGALLLAARMISGATKCLQTAGGVAGETATRCSGGSSTAVNVLGIAAFALLLLAPIGTAIYLSSRARPLAL
jgi:hypothetical protein